MHFQKLLSFSLSYLLPFVSYYRSFVVLSFYFATHCQPTLCQAQRINMGARAVAMGGASVSLSDSWAIFNNIGALAWSDQTSLLAAADNRFTVAGLNTLTAGFVMPILKKNTLTGITFSHFGDNLFNEINAGLGISHKINAVSLGLKLNYVQFSLQGLGTKGVLAVEFGGKMQFTKHIFVAAHIYNLNQAQLTDFQQEKLPTIMKAGLGIVPIEKLLLNIEAVKDIDHPANIRCGAEYKPIKKFSLRSGLSVNPLVYSYGVGLEVAAFSFDYALNTHTALLPAHHLSISYQFRKLMAKNSP
jgi:hypothetical protein